MAVIGGALLLFFSGFDSMANLQTVALRERLSEALGSTSARGLGITVDEMIGWIHVATLVTGGAAAAAAVLGWFALQRHRGARLALTAIAVVLIVCAPFAGGVLAAFVAAATAMLWSGQARDWFAGRPVRQREPLTQPAGRPSGDSPARTPGLPPAPETSAPSSVSAPPSPPAPTQGFGETPTAAPVFGQSPPAAVPWPGAAPQQPSYPSPQLAGPDAAPVAHDGPVQRPVAARPDDRRPGGVVAACVLTWLFSAAAAGLLVLTGLALLLEPARLIAPIIDQIESAPRLQDAGITSATAEPLLWAAIVFYLIWSLVACVLAWLTWRRHSWARILLVVSAGGVVALTLVTILFGGGLIALPYLLACVVAGALLLGGSANRWFAHRPQRPAAGPPSKAGPPRAW